jgi:hypothetical protein
VSGLVITIAVILNAGTYRKSHGRKILERAEAAP